MFVVKRLRVWNISELCVVKWLCVGRISELVGDEDNPEFCAIVSREPEGYPFFANVSTDFVEGNWNYENKMEGEPQLKPRDWINKNRKNTYAKMEWLRVMLEVNHVLTNEEVQLRYATLVQYLHHDTGYPHVGG